ncbi:Hypothetical protein SRAE_2000369700 [Strongyloides ratti]|uniref:Uncharacterized protein n=1 Tax=Strongyloides ratti TaxID=34506 RepID=A0A090LND6_STRRB|nr:Hypothetical protein SRAE_2000369700 [Strongyloides ratti]CEF69045.1 Hypothetical protein SRAE_2000369700 [Strongyloides ratti]
MEIENNLGIGDMPYYYRFVNEIKDNKLSWLDINLDIPYKLNNSIFEAIRLNELLATSTEICKNKTILDETYDDYYYCWDEKYFNDKKLSRKAVYFSGHNETKILFGQRLKIIQWYAFLMENNPVIDTLPGDTNFKAVDEMANGNLDVGSMISIFHNDILLITRLEPYSDKFIDKEAAYFKAIDIIEYLLPFLKTKFLQIEIKIGGKNTSDIIFKWYSLLYKLHFKYNFKIFGANSNGYCNRNYKGNCIYHVSFVKDNYTTNVPIFGFGSNDEERKRLIAYIYQLPSQCKQPLACNSCYKGNTSNSDINTNDGSYLSNEELLKSLMSEEKCTIIDFREMTWRMIDIILNDCQRIKRLALKIHVWFGEEGKNYRRYYGYFKKLEKCGLDIFLHSNPNPYTFVIILYRSVN